MSESYGDLLFSESGDNSLKRSLEWFKQVTWEFLSPFEQLKWQFK